MVWYGGQHISQGRERDNLRNDFVFRNMLEMPRLRTMVSAYSHNLPKM